MENIRNITPVKVEKTSLINLEKGKLPPQVIDLEEAVLGAMMIDSKGIDEVIDILKPDAFYKEPHKLIFEAIFKLYSGNEPIDLLTVSAQLKKDNKLELTGGDFYLIQLTQKISSSAHIDFHARIILQKYIQRSLIKTSSAIIEESYEDDADCLDVLDGAFKSLGELSDFINVGKTVDFRTEVLKYPKKKQAARGIPSSISNLDKKLNGYQNTDLIILAGRPGMGKTAFALNEILECALSGIPVGFFSLEMSTEQIIGRFLSIMSGIDSTKVKNMDLSESELKYIKQCAFTLSQLPIYIDDTAGLSTIEFKIKTKRLIREFGVKMVWVDYLQLMTIKDKKSFSRENEVSDISATLKATAKSMNIPVAALSQLSRAVEGRGASKRPQLSDLRDSGAIEQDADAVMFIYRPEYYKIDTWDDEEAAPTVNTAEIDLQKYRHGSIGVTRVGCQLRYMRFMDMESLGKDLTDRFFRSAEIKEKIVEFLPAITPQEAFGNNTNNDDDSDVPF
ncbi:replicative DNA helicase [Flavobacterium sp. 25HG05S-40]|uniref:replicative DNA helicase n=1 Tax=Flavobacterium sp. 25HG05S-40 TaxID=3458682 RepID=UPI004044FB7D